MVKTGRQNGRREKKPKENRNHTYQTSPTSVKVFHLNIVNGERNKKDEKKETVVKRAKEEMFHSHANNGKSMKCHME